ncbi:uncharacterized protein LOC127709100 [Mytilus californianus]|uniref:uncharacterized protein LOC127709100 n=1 Tax=Mytilus californianus TaxID=6549 RepID=UPI0022453D1C|nr:uncharacterized protein LOC127709100 [Mytilus californianus]
MELKIIWTVLFVFGFLSWKVKAGHYMTISSGRMTWLESFSYCSLASEDSIQYLVDGEYRGWVGGIYLNSQWMIHKGCYSNSGAMINNSVYDIKRLTPTLCSEKCKLIPYFALKYNWCLCLHSLYNLNDADSSKCTYKCPGSNNYVCGERSHFTVYKHITGKLQPKSDVDQNLGCSVIVPRNDTFVLKAVDCHSNYWTICVIYGVTRQMGFTETYQLAISRCSSLNGTILSIFDNLDNLEDGREYWSNIFRSMFLKWTTNESFDEICYKVDGLLNVDCLYLTVRYRAVKYIPLPCKYNGTAICKPKQPGDPAVIRQCQTKMFTAASTKDEISTRERSTSSTKEEISAEESKFASTTILASSNERTDVTAFLASKKSTILLAPSMPIKSIIVVASSTPSMSTDSKSTNFDYTKLVKRSSTKELHFSVTTTFSIAVLVILVVFVLVCLQVSLIGILRRHWRATQEGNQYELTSQFTTEPRMYAQPEIQHYEVVDEIPS